MRAALVAVAAVVAIAAQPAGSQDIRYFPVLQTEVASQVEIGVERSGTLTQLVVTTDKSSSSSSGSVVKTTTDLTVRNIEETKTKATNPEKRKSRPKAGGLFGGIARAFGGDYSGLIDWGAGFVDHMAEPKYNINVSKTYLTKDNHETQTVNVSNVAWSDASTFESTVTQNYSSDISKGFVRFSVALKNLSERSVTLAQPNFVIFFERDDGSQWMVGDVTASDSASHTIGAGQTRIYPIIIKNLDFISLTREYRRASAVNVHVQDVKMRGSDGALQAMASVWDDYKDTRIRFDYFDGNARSVRYVQVPASGLTTEEFLQQALSGLTYELYPLAPGAPVDTAVRRVGSQVSDARLFSAVPVTEQPKWRRWFLTTHDRLGTLFEAARNDRIYPGYSVQLGYYSSDQILPPTRYRPAIFERQNVVLRPNEQIHIPVDLKPGDIIAFEDLNLTGFEVPVVRFSSASRPYVQCLGAYGIFYEYSPAALDTAGFENGNLSQCHALSPQSASRADINPKTLFFTNAATEAQVDETAAAIILSGFALEFLSQSFLNTRDLQYAAAGASITSVTMKQSDLDQAANMLSLKLQPGETLSRALSRFAKESESLTFVVEKDTPAQQGYWTFFQPFKQVRPIHVQSVSALPTDVEAEYLNNGTSLTYVKVCPDTPAWLCAQAPSFAPWPGADILPNPVGGARFRQASNGPLLKSVFLTRVDAAAAPITVPSVLGPKLTATLRVFRYSEDQGSAASLP